MTVAKFIEQLSKFDGNAEVCVNRDYIIDGVTFGFGNTVSIESSEAKKAIDNLKEEVSICQQVIEELQIEIEAMQTEIEELEEEK